MDKVYASIACAKRIVVKVGTSTLAYETGHLNLRRVESLVKVLADIKNMGKEIILVSSGAIGVGAGLLGFACRPTEKREKQAAAAVGQCELMNIYAKLFRQYGHTVGQILMTKDVVDEFIKKENVINTFSTLLDHHVLPIVNENDSVSTEEEDFGDNDNLSAIVAKLSGAQLLILLSDIDGLYDKNPKENKDAKQIPVVHNITQEMEAGAKGTSFVHGTGGMTTKLSAAKTANAAGIHMVIANGWAPEVLYDIVEGKPGGTLFVGK